jgi:beta-alanine degradation protein BauB
MGNPIAQQVSPSIGHQARRQVLVDDSDSRITYWHMAPGEETGWHSHEHDYFVVNLTDATLHQFLRDGRETHNTNKARDTHGHPAGVEHNVRNEGANPVLMYEIEYKRSRA